METGNSINPNLISVIVPAYNAEAYIDRCVQSVLAQEYTCLELILVDGASRDGTLSLCRAWQKRDERVRVFHTPVNRGVSSGRNTGMQKARGAFFFFLDADDWLMPDCLKRLHDEMQDERIDIAGCAFDRCTHEDWEKLSKQLKSGEYESIEREPVSRCVTAGQDFLQEGILKRDTRCWSKLYRRKLVEGHLFREDFTIGEDMLFLWEVSACADQISSISYPGYCYYHNPGGAMLRRFRPSDMDQIRCWQVVLEHLQEKPDQRAEEANVSAVGSDGHKENDTSVIPECATILLVSCMLVAGKLAQLTAQERKQYQELRRQCSQVLEETLRIPGAYEGLDRGYRIKVGIYRRAPRLYLWLYHLAKRNG